MTEKKQHSILLALSLILVLSLLSACAAGEGNDRDRDDQEPDGDNIDGDVLPDGDGVMDGDASDGDTPLNTAAGDEQLRGYFCENDGDCQAMERCLPFSDASARICLPQDFIRFTDDQTFILDLAGIHARIEQNEKGEDLIDLKGFSDLSEPGNPDLPFISFNVLLPADADLSKVDFEVLASETVDVPGFYDMAAAGPASWRPDLEDVPTYEDWLAQQPNIVMGRNTEIYSVDSFWPVAAIRLDTPSQMRKWKFVRVHFSPYAYNPVVGLLQRTGYIKIHISAPVESQKSGLADLRRARLLADKVMDRQAASMFSNYQSMESQYQPPAATPFKDDDLPKSDFLIMTTQAIKDKSQVLEQFVAHKKSIGFSVLVITEEQYGVLEGVDTAEKARNWLKDNYAARGIQYLLIISDPNKADGPFMRVCWPRYNKEEKKDKYEKTATDAYYADLTGNWNKDGDDNWCEYGRDNGDTGYGGLDLTPELYVGRIPVYDNNTSRLDDILEMSMAYELQQDIEWRRKVMLPNPISDFSHEIDHGDDGEDEEVKRGHTVDGAKFAERMKRDFLNERNKLTSFSLYDSRGAEPSDYTPDREFSEAAVCEEWAKGYGITSWWAHGNSSSAAGKTWLEDKNDDGIADRDEKEWEDFAHNGMSSNCFDSIKPTFTSQVSCLNHKPDRSNNLGHYLLYKGGAVTTMGATSVTLYSPSWYSPNSHRMDNVSFGYYYTDYLARNFSAGRALAMVRSKPCSFSWGDGTLMNMLSFNIYGDPSLSVFTTYQPAEEVESASFEDKGHSFDKGADTDKGKGLRWDLQYQLKPGDQVGTLAVTVGLYDESGEPLNGPEGELILKHEHTVGGEPLIFDGDKPDRFELSHAALAFLGSGEHTLQYDIKVVFNPDEGDAELFFDGEAKSFELALDFGPGIVELTLDQATEGALSESREFELYRLDFAEGPAELSVVLDGPAEGADFDLYVRLGEEPTQSDYDGRGYSSSADETVVLENAEDGEYFIMVHRYSGSGAYTLTVSLGNEDEGPTVLPLPLDDVIRGELESGGSVVYSFEVDEGASFSVLTSCDSGNNFHLFLGRDEIPSSEQFDASATELGTDQWLTHEVTIGTWYLMVHAATGSGSFELLAWVE